MKKCKIGLEGKGLKLMKNWREWRVPCLFLCGKYESGLSRLIILFDKNFKQVPQIISMAITLVWDKNKRALLIPFRKWGSNLSQERAKESQYKQPY